MIEGWESSRCRRFQGRRGERMVFLRTSWAGAASWVDRLGSSRLTGKILVGRESLHVIGKVQSSNLVELVNDALRLDLPTSTKNARNVSMITGGGPLRGKVRISGTITNEPVERSRSLTALGSFSVSYSDGTIGKG